MESAVYSLAEAAAVLGIGRTTAFQLARRGEFPVPVLKVGSSQKVAKQAIERFLAAATPTPAVTS